MPITIDGVTIEKVTIDGTEQDKVTVDGVTVFESTPTYAITVTANGTWTQYVIKEGELARTVVPYVSREGWSFYGWFEFGRDDMDFNPDTTRVYRNYSITAKWYRSISNGTCPTCKGTGKETKTELCGICGGDGGYYDTCNNCSGSGEAYEWHSCETCYGMGNMGDFGELCPYCNGDTCEECNWSGYAICPTCEGAGGYDSYGECGTCGGDGEKYYYCYDCDDGYVTSTGTCGNCHGWGQTYTTEYEYY